jgi:chromosome segregation ATPase
MQKRQASEECAAKRQELDILSAKLEKYLKEIPLIQRVMELESELEETRKMSALRENHVRVLTKERDNAERESMRLRAEVIELDARNKELERRLSRCRSSTTSIID